MEIFGRHTETGNVAVLHVEDGLAVTRIRGAYTVYPVDSQFSCDWEHPEGIVLTKEDAERLCIEIE